MASTRVYGRRITWVALFFTASALLLRHVAKLLIDVPNDADSHSETSRGQFVDSRKSRSATDGVWFDYSVSDNLNMEKDILFYAYSAFYDERIENLPAIRVIAISSKISSDDRPPVSDIQVYCVLRYFSGRVDRFAVEMPPTPIGVGYPLHGNLVGEYIYTCRPGSASMGASRDSSENDEIPTFISIQVSRGQGRQSQLTDAERENLLLSMQWMPVERASRSESQMMLAACVQIAYNDLEPFRLVEWLELQRLLGIELVVVYASPTVSPRAMDVFRHYDGDLVELRQSSYIAPPVAAGRPRPNASSWINKTDQYLLHGSPVINDCIYRHMHHVRNFAVIDFDEAIIPRIHSNLVDLISHELSSSTAKNYVFRNQYFFLDSPPDSDISDRFTVLRFRYKVELSQPGYSTKSIISSQSCLAMHNHYCWTSIEQETNRLRQRGAKIAWGRSQQLTTTAYLTDVPTSLALLHHYKRCHLDKTQCSSMLGRVSLDDTVLKYQHTLMSAVNRKLDEIYITDRRRYKTTEGYQLDKALNNP